MSIEAINNLNTCFDSVDALLAGLSDDQWAVQSYCPDWDVRGVAMHLAAVEHMLIGEEPGSWTDSVPFDKVGAYVGDVSGLDNAALLERVRATLAERRAEMATYAADQMDLPSMTPVGPQTYGRFMAIRVFDFWVHEQDIRGPLGIPGHESGATAEMALNEIEISLPYIVGKKIGLPDGKSLTFELTGPVERIMHVAVDGRAGNVESLDGPADVVVSANSTTWALLACGRVDPQAEIDAGRISWSGDAEWGETAARNLRFTM
ncbi:MAG: maleylpyruvate isomerase family mycothiol-dependent enzyme [Actinomycetota bacterium]